MKNKRPLSPASSAQSPGVFDRWASRVIILGVALTPFVLCLEMDDTFDLPKLACLYAVDLLLIALWARQGLAQGVFNIRRTALDLPLFVFLLIGGVSTVFSIDPRLSLLGAYKIYTFGLLPLTALALLFWLTAQAASPRMIVAVETAAIGAGVGVGVYGLLQYTGYEIFERMPSVIGGRVWSSLGNPIYVGALAVMAALVALAVVLRRPGAFSARLVPLSAFFVLVASAGLSLSRSAWVGFLVGLFLLIWTFKKALAHRAALGVILCGAVVIVAILPGVRQRASVLLSVQEHSNAARLAGWKAGLKIFCDHPVLGTGPDTFFQAFRPYRDKVYLNAASVSVTQADAHNDAIQFLSTEGLAGGIAFLWLLIAFIRRWKRDGFGGPDHVGLAAALVALAVQNQFNFSSITTSLWAAVFAGLLCGRGQLPRPIPVTPWSRGAAFLLFGACPVGVWAIFVPLRADMAYKAAQAADQQGQPVAAASAYQRAIDLQGRVEIYQTQLANALRTLGTLSSPGAQREGYLDRAWAVATTVTREHPFNPDGWNNRGVIAMWLFQMAQRDLRAEARKCFEEAVRLDPVFVDAWANLARWEHLEGHLEIEKDFWRKVLELDPNHGMAAHVLGENKTL